MSNLKKITKLNKNQKYMAMASMSALLAACGSSATTGAGNVSGAVTSGNDNVVLGGAGGGGVVDLLAGDDVVVGGDFADFIRGGAGADNIQAGGGVDNIVVVGVSSNGSYTLSDIENPNGTGVDLSVLINLAAVNDNAVSDVQAGEVIDGGADGAHLFVYGDVDFTQATLSNITRIDVQSAIKFTATQLKDLIDKGEFNALIGDGTSTIEITHDGSAIVLDFSKVDMQNIKQIILGPGVTLLLDQDDLRGVQGIEGSGTIKAVNGDLDVSGIAVDAGIVVATASTPTATPTPTPVGNSISLTAPSAKLSTSDKDFASDYTTQWDDTISSTKANADGAEIDAAGGADTLNITTDAKGTVGLSDIAGGFALDMKLTDVETVVFQNTSAAITLEAHNGENIIVDGGNVALSMTNAHTSQNGQTITVNNTVGTRASYIYLSNHTGLIVKLGTGNDRVFAVQSADANISTGDGGDSVYISSDSGGQNSNGTNASAILNAATLEGATIDGGNGNNTLKYNTDKNGAAQSALTLSSGIKNFTTFDMSDQDGTVDTIFTLGNAGFEVITAFAGNQASVFNIDAGNLSVLGSGGANETVNFTTAGTFTLEVNVNWDNVALSNGTNNVSMTSTSLVRLGNAAGDSFIGGNTANDTITLTTAATASVLGAANTQGVSGVEYIILSDGGTITTVNSNVASGETLNITNNSTSALTFNGAAEADGKFVIDNSASSGVSALIGGAGADSITGGSGVDTMTGGGGVDTFIIATADVNTTLGAVTDVIVDFQTGGADKIDTSGAAGSVTNYAEAGATVGSLAALLTAADTALTGAVTYYVGETGGNAYLVTDFGGGGYTDVVQLTGRALADISFSDIA